MKTPVVVAALVFGFLEIASAENITPASPDRPALALPVARIRPASPVALAPLDVPTREERAIRQWKLSLIPLAASQTLDVTSSWGMRELNPALAGRDGTFGGQAALMKLGVMGAFVGVEYLVVRKHPHSAAVFQKINWSGAALTSGFAVHNYLIR